MPVDPHASVRISAFKWVPPFAQGHVRDLRARWARGLDAFSRTNPSMAKGTTLPNYEQSEVMLWPPKRTFFPFAPAPQDIRHTADWHRASTEQRRLNDQRIDRELAEMEAAKKEFYRGH